MDFTNKTMFPRPTIEAYFDFTGETELPRLSETLLFELNWAMLKKAQQEWVKKSERIKSIDDNYFYKCKGSQERAALFLNENEEEAWLVALGLRRNGDIDDFYQDLTRKCKAELKRMRNLNPSWKVSAKSDSDFLLPGPDDYTRLTAEREYVMSRDNQDFFLNLISKSVTNLGLTHTVEWSGNNLEVITYEQEGLFILNVGFTSVDKKRPQQIVQEKILSLLKGKIDPYEINYVDRVKNGSMNVQQGATCLEFFLSNNFIRDFL